MSPLDWLPAINAYVGGRPPLAVFWVRCVDVSCSIDLVGTCSLADMARLFVVHSNVAARLGINHRTVTQ